MLLGFAVGVAVLLVGPFQAVRSFEENKGLGLLFKLRGEKRPSLDVREIGDAHKMISFLPYLVINSRLAGRGVDRLIP